MMIRVPFFLLFGLHKGTLKKNRAKRALLRNLVDPKPLQIPYRTL